MKYCVHRLLDGYTHTHGHTRAHTSMETYFFLFMRVLYLCEWHLFDVDLFFFLVFEWFGYGGWPHLISCNIKIHNTYTVFLWYKLMQNECVIIILWGIDMFTVYFYYSIWGVERKRLAYFECQLILESNIFSTFIQKVVALLLKLTFYIVNCHSKYVTLFRSMPHIGYVNKQREQKEKIARRMLTKCIFVLLWMRRISNDIVWPPCLFVSPLLLSSCLSWSFVCVGIHGIYNILLWSHSIRRLLFMGCSNRSATMKVYETEMNQQTNDIINKQTTNHC